MKRFCRNIFAARPGGPRRMPASLLLTGFLLIAGVPGAPGPVLAMTPAADAAAASADPGQAQKVRHPERAPLLAAARAGTRIVAIGDFGIILLSDDDGISWRQAQSVPTRRTLTAVQFIDDRHGWIVGHNGTVLHTSDAGEHWRALTSPDEDVALFSVSFDDPQHGLVVGAFGFAARTDDGGASWELLEVTDEDPHLYRIFHDAGGAVWIAAEMGNVFRSRDGLTFETVEVPYTGSFWGGMKAPDDSLLLWGMSGTLLRSTDNGRSWRQTDTGTDNPITDACVTSDGRLILVGLSGTVLTSRDNAATVHTEIRPDRRAYTSVIAIDDRLLAFSLEGTENARQP